MHSIINICIILTPIMYVIVAITWIFVALSSKKEMDILKKRYYLLEKQVEYLLDIDHRRTKEGHKTSHDKLTEKYQNRD